MVRFLRRLSAVVFLTVLVPDVNAQPPVDAVGDPLPKGFLYRLGTTRLRHWVAVGTRFAPDGKHLLSVGETDECLVWDVATGKLVKSLPRAAFPLAISSDGLLSVSHAAGALQVTEWPGGKLVHALPLEKLQEVAFTADRKTLVALTEDHWLYRWDLGTGKELGRKHIPLVDSKYWVDPRGRLSPDGTVLAGVLQRERADKGKTLPLRFWDVATGKELRLSLAVAGSYFDGRWSPDGTRFFALSLPYEVEVFDLKTGKKVGPDKEATAQKGLGAEIVEVTPDGQGLLLAKFGGLAYYDLATGKTRWGRRVAPEVSGPLLKLSTVISFSFNPTDRTVAVGCSCGHIALLDWTTGKDVGFSSRHPGYFREPVQYSGDGTLVLVTDAMTERRSLHDARTGRELRRLAERDILAWSPDGKRLADWECTGLKENDPNYLLMKDLDSGKVLWKIRAWPDRARFSSDGKVFSYLDLDDRSFHQVDADTGKSRQVFRLPAAERKDAEPDEMSLDGRFVVVRAKEEAPGGFRGWKELQVWDINGKKRWTWAIPDDWQWGRWDVQFLQDNRHLVINGYLEAQRKGVVCIFDATTGKKVSELTAGSSHAVLAASPDGRSLLLEGKDTRELRDVATGRLLFNYKFEGRRSYLHKPAFAPDSKLCAFSSDDYTVEVREVQSGKLVNRFHRSTYFVRDITFAPDSRTLALTFNDCTVWMWDALAEPLKQ
jgi:WD40 repeat protein